MIHDYYLSENQIKSFEEWDKEKEDLFKNEYKKNEWREKDKEEKYKMWLEEVFAKPLAQQKKEILNKITESGKENYKTFYPNPSEDIKNLPKNSVFIKISFTLKKSYTSKDEGEFHIIENEYLFSWSNKKEISKFLQKISQKKEIEAKDIKINENKISYKNVFIRKIDNFAFLEINRKKIESFLVKKENSIEKIYSYIIFENPIVRDKFTGLPIVKSSTWKGHLRFAAERSESKNKEIIERLFGSENKKGRLHFFPTFFDEKIERDVITPLKRDTRTPARGPIYIEVMKSGSKGEFYLLYIPYPKSKDFKENEIEEDLKFLAEALKSMFYDYGFSAKKTSEFGVINNNLDEGKIWINQGKSKKFSNLEELKENLKLSLKS